MFDQLGHRNNVCIIAQAQLILILIQARHTPNYLLGYKTIREQNIFQQYPLEIMSIVGNLIRQPTIVKSVFI